MAETKSKKEKRTKMPELLAEDVVDVQFAKEELVSLTNLMTIMAKTFEALAKESLMEKNEDAFNILIERSQLSSTYATKFASICSMGEIQSRELH